MARGRPAAGLRVELYRIGAEDERIAAATTNADGRVEPPLVEGTALTAGVYELRFHAGPYLSGVAIGKAASFLDVIPVRFGVGAPEENYHVPLLLSPYGYSTYRGS
jgi:5-hydroxyisourate hydrolase